MKQEDAGNGAEGPAGPPASRPKNDVGTGTQGTLRTRLKLLLRVLGAIAGALLFLFLLESELHYNVLDLGFWGVYRGVIIGGFLQTLLYSAVVPPAGMLIGFFTGWARSTKYKFLTYPATLYVDIIRGIPPIVMILFAFFFGPFILPALFDPTQGGRIFAAIALALHTGAYQAEIFRAGFQSVPRGQIDAATAVGLSREQTMARVVLPQTFRLVLPALGNELATVIKDTALLGAIGVPDLFYVARGQSATATIFTGRDDWIFALWTVIAIAYFVLTFIVTRVLQFVERKYAIPGLGSVSV